ncbi:DUF2202 domain-containing protein [Plantactinospora sp. WMMB334]|uniref:DUF2202 domain-containing protein n=1 Tax=Plantactinospora sp. WMMB334 TaxID=3404119 RepID=UPI003B95339F
MKTNRRMSIVVAAGLLSLGGLAIAAPALAGLGPSGPGPSGPARTATANPGDRGQGMGYGHGMGSGYGMGYGDGSCMGLDVTAEQGTLTGAQQATLVSMAWEEKVAHDLYVRFADRYDAVVFDRIATAENRHLAAIRTLLARYGITDPTAGLPAGTFTDPAAQASYDRLLAQGNASLSAALAVGQQVEREDIAALKAALNGLTAADVTQVYNNLLTTSERHLTAFTRWPTR